MLNQLVLVGRLTETPTLENETSTIILAVQRPYKNENGEYETDFIKCTLIGNVASNTTEYCRKGDMIGVKGRLQSRDGQLEVVADKVTFLATKKEKEN